MHRCQRVPNGQKTEPLTCDAKGKWQWRRAIKMAVLWERSWPAPRSLVCPELHAGPGWTAQSGQGTVYSLLHPSTQQGLGLLSRDLHLTALADTFPAISTLESSE